MTCAKIKYASPGHANRAREERHLKARFAYWCDECAAWHLTRRATRWKFKVAL